MIHRLIEQCLQEAVVSVLPDAKNAVLLVRPCPDPKFGDYQTNALMSLAKQRKMNPRQLAADVLAKLDVSEWCEKVEIAGAGFLNFRLKLEAITRLLQGAARGEHLFFTKSAAPRTLIMDFSSPNVAKPMHVGHIRSTILGDCLARVFRLLGHRVITDNHIGDWGTQFGKLIVGWKRRRPSASSLQSDPLDEMEKLYREINTASESDPALLEEARRELVRLQSGDEENVRIWGEMIDLSQHQFDEIYARLDVRFDETRGESAYNSRLKGIVDELKRRGLARESEGAIAVFFEDHPDLKGKPAIIQKSDGGFNYTTTDLATLAYRLETWRPDEIIYVTDARQQLHFQQLFAIFRMWHPDANVKLTHVWFGSILGEDGKPFKTRSGGTIKLTDLLNEAESRAFDVVNKKNPDLSGKEKDDIAPAVGIGAIKYADLLPNRQSDYVFSWERMLALDGNTAPYLQYAYTRTRSLARKAAQSGIRATDITDLKLGAPEEIALAKHLLNFGLVLEAVAEEYRPNFLCNYLYDLAGLLSQFWERCPVLKSDDPERTSRLVLSNLTGSVLRQGLEVLGIKTLEQM